MSPTPYLHSLLVEPETEALHRLITLVEHLFRVPIAYIALLDGAGRVASRIGSGHEDGRVLAKLPIEEALVRPLTVLDTASPDVPVFDWGDLRFLATAPLRSSDGLTLGLLAIADRTPRSGFSDQDEASLVELAQVLAGKMELRRIAAHALQAEIALREIEGRFRALADAAPVLMACGGPDGGATFVNRAWLEFTGREIEQELGAGWSESIHPDCREEVVGRYWKAFAMREELVLEVPFRRHDGLYRQMSARCGPRFREDGGFAGFIGCLVEPGAFRRSTA